MKEKIMQTIIITLVILSLIISTISLSMVFSTNKRIDRMNYEYQMVVEDDSVKIFDGSRYVGTTLLEGELNEMIIEDNQ